MQFNSLSFKKQAMSVNITQLCIKTFECDRKMFKIAEQEKKKMSNIKSSL